MKKGYLITYWDQRAERWAYAARITADSAREAKALFLADPAFGVYQKLTLRVCKERKRPRHSGRPLGPAMPCGWKCGARLTAREMRAHFTNCPRRPSRPGPPRPGRSPEEKAGRGQ